MHAQILRAKKALLLCRDRGEEHVVRRRLRRLRKGPRHFQQNAAAGAVVGRAVVDVVALGVGIDAEMIVVRGVENGVAAGRCSGHTRQPRWS